MWGGTDETESIATIRAALEHGINVIDTAPVYGFGRSEELVGKAIAPRAGCARACLLPPRPGWNGRTERVFRNASRTRILREVEDSLRRLRTDHIDIYQVHWPDPLVPIEETAEAMHTLFHAGKDPRHRRQQFFDSPDGRISAALRRCMCCNRPTTCSSASIEADILPYCRTNKIATFGYGALCRGLLSGRMRPNMVFDGDDLRRTDPKFQHPRFPDQILPPCNSSIRLGWENRFDKHVVQLAIRWILDQGITTALWGARHPLELEPVEGSVAGWPARCVGTRSEIDQNPA